MWFPQRAEAKVNFRLLPGDTQDIVLKHVRAVVDDPAIEISYDRWDNLPPVATHEGGGFEVISNAIRSVYPEALVAPSLLTATTDTRHYVGLADHLYRFHGVIIASRQASSVHGTDEYVAVESFERSIAVAREMLRLGSQAGPGEPGP